MNISTISPAILGWLQGYHEGITDDPGDDVTPEELFMAWTESEQVPRTTWLRDHFMMQLGQTIGSLFAYNDDRKLRKLEPHSAKSESPEVYISVYKFSDGDVSFALMVKDKCASAAGLDLDEVVQAFKLKRPDIATDDIPVLDEAIQLTTLGKWKARRKVADA